MFSWHEFSSKSKAVIEREAFADAELARLLVSETPPPRLLDTSGKPLSGGALITEHREPDRFRWITALRDRQSLEHGDEKFHRYARRVLEFFEEFGPFSDNNPLYVVQITTPTDSYEFLYAAKHKAVAGQAVGGLTEPRGG